MKPRKFIPPRLPQDRQEQKTSGSSTANHINTSQNTSASDTSPATSSSTLPGAKTKRHFFAPRTGQQPFASITETSKLPPLQRRHQQRVNAIQDELDRGFVSYDIGIYQKYQVKQYQLNDLPTPTEVFIFDAKSKPFPLLEDQARKRFSSLMTAATQLFRKQHREVTATFDALQNAFESGIQASLATPINNKEDFKKQFKALHHLMSQVMENLAYIWGKSHSKEEYSSLGKKDYMQFFRDLYDAVEESTPPFKLNNLMTLNLDPDVRRVEYCERCTTRANGHRDYRSSHKRDGIGIPNFAVASSGLITEHGDLVMTTPGDFSNASLPPIEFYRLEKEKKAKIKIELEDREDFSEEDEDSSDEESSGNEQEIKEEKGVDEIPETIKASDGFYTPESLSITRTNFLHMENEIRSRLTPEENKSDGNRPYHATLYYTLLLTVLRDKENQQRIYSETVTAADLLRTRPDSQFSPVVFDFGVNFAASTRTGLVYILPPAQEFENLRSFYHLQKNVLSTLAPAIEAVNTDNSGKDLSIANPLNDLYQRFLEMSSLLQNGPNNFEEEIEAKLFAHFRDLDTKLTAFEKDPSDANRIAVYDKKVQLENSIKPAYYEKAHQIFKPYMKAYNALAKDLRKSKALLEGFFNDEYRGTRSPMRAIYATVTDFADILEQFCSKHPHFSMNKPFRSRNTYGIWMMNDNNFKIQTRLGEIAENMGALSYHFPNSRAPFQIYTGTYGCKSRCDRSQVDGVGKTALSARMDVEKPVDMAKSLRSSLSNQIAIIDTDGGGAKYGGHIYDPAGHPSRSYARMQAKTSKWASKKLFTKLLKALKKESVYAPQATLTPLITVRARPRLSVSVSKNPRVERLAKIFMPAIRSYSEALRTAALALQTAILASSPSTKPSLGAMVQRYFEIGKKHKLGLMDYMTLEPLLRIYLAEMAKRLPPPLPTHVPRIQEEKENISEAKHKLREKIHEQRGVVDTLHTFESAFNKQTLAFFGSGKVKANEPVVLAYRAFAAAENHQNPSPLPEQVDLLLALKEAVDNWLLKNRTEEPKLKENGELSIDPRIPIILALRDHIKEKIQEKQEAIYESFAKGELTYRHNFPQANNNANNQNIEGFFDPWEEGPSNS